MAIANFIYFGIFLKLIHPKFVIFFCLKMRKKSTKLKKKMTFRSSHPFPHRGTHGFRRVDHARMAPLARRARPPRALVRGAGSNLLRMVARRIPSHREGLNLEDRDEIPTDKGDFTLITLRFYGIRHSTGPRTGFRISGYTPDHDLESAASKGEPEAGRESMVRSRVIDIRAAFTRREGTSSHGIEFEFRSSYKIMGEKGGKSTMYYLIKKLNSSITYIMIALRVYKVFNYINDAISFF